MKFDIIHFEALGAEALHLENEIHASMQAGLLPTNHRYDISPLPVQDYLRKNSEIELPAIITVKGHSKIPSSYVAGDRKSIIFRGAGYDSLEYLAAVVNLTSLQEYCVNAVAQTAMKFLYATAGYYNCYANAVQTFDRKNVPSFMELNDQRVATVFGVGRIGKRIYELLLAQGLTVQGVDIRSDELSVKYGNHFKFVSATEAVAHSDVIINGMNLNKNPDSPFYNVGYFNSDFFSLSSKELIFINMTRGEIAPESVVLDQYKKNKFIGLGIDVFGAESDFSEMLRNNTQAANEDLAAAKELVEISLGRKGNVYVQPHQAFNSDVAAKTKATEAIKHVVYWFANDQRRFAEQVPYYQ